MNRITDIITELIQEDVGSVKSVSGGSINQAFDIKTVEKRYFLKLSEEIEFDNVFYIEAKTLEILGETETFRIPKVERYGKQFLLLEFIESGREPSDFWQKFALNLAKLHSHSSSYFGLEFDNYIGSLPQKNTPSSTWEEFYASQRILPLIRQTYDRGITSQRTRTQVESFCSKIGELFPSEAPALLHGDLWSGNFMCSKSGEPAVFDPAIYFGHREMDIAMTQLFGGFSGEFYSCYNDYKPLDIGWQSRMKYSKIYPLLVHSVLFGGHYVSELSAAVEQF